jgi:hypothetical protein
MGTRKSICKAIEITSARETKTAKFFVAAFDMKIIHWARRALA